MSSDLLAARFAERGFAIGPCQSGSGFLKRAPGRRFAGPSDQLAGTGLRDTENIRRPLGCSKWSRNFLCSHTLSIAELTRRTGKRVAAVPSRLVIRACETSIQRELLSALLFLFQSERVNIVRSHVANQHWCVCRIKAHPKSERACVAESLEIDNALRIAPRYADSKHARIIRRA
jgi:hypothetical protein